VIKRHQTKSRYDTWLTKKIVLRTHCTYTENSFCKHTSTANHNVLLDFSEEDIDFFPLLLPF